MAFDYTVNLDLSGRPCVVVGGGPIAAERAEDLLASGAEVTVIADAVTHGIEALAAAGRIALLRRPWRPGDLAGAFLAVATREHEQDVEGMWAEAEDQRVLFSALDDIPHCHFGAVATVRRGDLKMTVSTAGKAPALAKRIRQQLERDYGPEYGDLVEVLHEARTMALPRTVTFAEWAARWGRALRDLPGLASRLRRGDRAGVRDRVLAEITGVMAGPDLPVDDRETAGARPGVVHLVGGGPGDPGLLTLRAAELLRTADVIAYDRLAPLAVLDLAPGHAERICVGKGPGGRAWSQEEINALLVTEARAGRAVVRLKGGDPFVFGRGGEEVLACRAAGVPVEVVPGVTSALAAPAAAGIPVTHRGVATGVAVVTGHEDPAKPGAQVDYEALARFPGTLVFLMGVASVRRIASELMAGGLRPSMPVGLVRWGTTARQEVLVADLATVADEVERTGFASPATIVVGDVVGLRGRIAEVANEDALLAALA